MGSGTIRTDPKTGISGPSIETICIWQPEKGVFVTDPMVEYEGGTGEMTGKPIYISPDDRETPVNAASVTGGLFGYVVVDRDDIPVGKPIDGLCVKYSVETKLPLDRSSYVRGEKSFSPVFNELVDVRGQVRKHPFFPISNCQDILPPKIQRANAEMKPFILGGFSGKGYTAVREVIFRESKPYYPSET